MSRLSFLFLSIFFLLAPAQRTNAEEVRHLLVAKFLLQRIEGVGLSESQMAEFNRLSAELRTATDELRKEGGISKEVMARRDEAHRGLKGQKLPEAEYWTRLQSEAGLNAEQLEAFQETQANFDAFKETVLSLLSEEQKSRLAEANAARKAKASKE